MLDLETMGKGPGCAIVAIGAVMYVDGEKEGPVFYETVDLQSCVDAGLTIDASTVMWWLRQGDEARGALDGRRIPLSEALDDFTEWLGGDVENVRIWGNGSDFDNAVLAAAYRALGRHVPWKFWNNRCYRTLKSLRPDILIERQGTHHNAISDACSQGEHLTRIFNALETPHD